MSIEAPSWAPSTVRSELVVWEATLRFSEPAPVSVKAFWVAVKACRRAKGVTKALLSPPKSKR
jgi:hypothetical protein